MGTLDLRYDSVKKQVSLTGSHRWESKHDGLRAIAASVVIFYADDEAESLQASSHGNHENVPASLSFIPAPGILGASLQQTETGSAGHLPSSKGTQHRPYNGRVNRVSFNMKHTRAVDAEQDVYIENVEDRMLPDDCLTADVVGGGQCEYPVHSCGSAGYDDVEMSNYGSDPSASMCNMDEAAVGAGLPVQIKIEPLSPHGSGIESQNETAPSKNLQHLDNDLQPPQKKLVPNSSKNRNPDDAQGDTPAPGAEGNGVNRFEVQELKQEDDSDLESLPLHFLTDQGTSCTANLDLSVSVCGNPYESIMTDSVDLTELPVAQADASTHPEAEAGILGGQNGSESTLASLEDSRSQGEEGAGAGNGMEASMEADPDCNGDPAGKSISSQDELPLVMEVTSGCSVQEASYGCGTPEASDSADNQNEETSASSGIHSAPVSSFPGSCEEMESAGLTAVQRGTPLEGAHDATGGSAVSDACAGALTPEKMQLIDLTDIKKEPEPDDCCIVGVTPGRRVPSVPSASGSQAAQTSRGNVGSHFNRMQVARRPSLMERRSEFVHRHANMPPRAPSRMPARVPSRAPSRQAMYYGYVVRRELQRHQMGGGAAPRRRRRHHNYSGGKYGSCAVCHADIFNYTDYLNHLEIHRDRLEDANSFSCPMCLKKSHSYLEIANSHASSHVDKDLHTCPVCKSHIYRKDNFRRHFTLRHPNDMAVLTRYLSQYKKLVTGRLQRHTVKSLVPDSHPSHSQGPVSLPSEGSQVVVAPPMPFSQGFGHSLHNSPGRGENSLLESQMADHMQRQLAMQSQMLAPPPQAPMGGRPRENMVAPEMLSPPRPHAPPAAFPPQSLSLPTSFADIEARYAQTSGLSLNQPTHPITQLVQSVLQHEASTSQLPSMPCGSNAAFSASQFPMNAPQPNASVVRNMAQAPASAQKGASGGEMAVPSRSRIGKFANLCCFCMDSIQNKTEYGRHLDLHHQKGCDFLCPICRTTLSTRSCCLRHADSHSLTGTDQNQCPKCQKIFVRADNFKRHLRIVHNMNTTPRKNIKVESP